MNAIWLIMLPYMVFADVSEFDKFCINNASGSTNVTTEKTRVPICRDSESDGINITVSVECALPEPALRVSVFHCENQTAKVVICESSDTFARCNFSFSIKDMKKRFICVKYERNGAVPFQVRDFDINTCTCDTPTPNPQTTSQLDTNNETTSSPTLRTNTCACINNETDGGFRLSIESFFIGMAVVVAVGAAVGVAVAVAGICILLIYEKVKRSPVPERDRQPMRVGTDGNEKEDRVDTAAIVDDSNSHDSTGEMALLTMRKRPRKPNSDRTVGPVTVEEARERDSYLPQTFPIQQEASGGGTLVSMNGPQA